MNQCKNKSNDKKPHPNIIEHHTLSFMEGKYSVSESNSQNKFWLLPNEAIFLGAAQKYKLSAP
ncbi:MAG: hypothetical protein WC230_02515, partial [Bacteroidales bacterium]